MRTVEKYVRIYTLRQAKKGENVCAYYPHPVQNTCGRKDEPHMLKAEQDAKDGKCKLLVWRKVEVPDDYFDRLSSEG